MDTDNGFQCLCRDGYEGPLCDRAINDCVSDPCMNGGSCIDEHNGFRCVCPSGYTGDKCQTNIDDCVRQPCLNGGTCIDLVDAYKCHCRPGFLGELCQTNVDDCTARPCANGGTCIDGVNNFTCHCRQGWKGFYCTEPAPESESPCASSPCRNNGHCIDDPALSAGYRCHCPHGFVGPKCTVPAVQPIYSTNESINKVEEMSTLQIVMVVFFSIAVPAIAIGSIIAIICMKRRRNMQKAHEDEEARRQNEQNMVHNAVNAVNNSKCIEDHMIFNPLDYPAKPINTDNQNIHQYETIQNHQQDNFNKKAIDNTYTIIPARNNNKTLNTDTSRLSLASRLEKDLDAVTCHRASPVDSIIAGSIASCKTPDPHLPRTFSHR